MAVLSALELWHGYGIKVQLVMTFGQPRVGDPAFASHFQHTMAALKTPYYRVVHNKDPIPHAPAILMGYWHSAYEVSRRPLCVGGVSTGPEVSKHGHRGRSSTTAQKTRTASVTSPGR
jgi:hypothetical protein